MELLVEVAGWTGMAVLLLAYALSALGVLPAATRRAAALNLLGGLCLALHTGAHAAYPATVLNTTWAVIAIVALARGARDQASTSCTTLPATSVSRKSRP